MKQLIKLRSECSHYVLYGEHNFLQNLEHFFTFGKFIIFICLVSGFLKLRIRFLNFHCRSLLISLSYESEVFRAAFNWTYSRMKIYSELFQNGQFVRTSIKQLFFLWNFFDAYSCSSTSERRIFVARTLFTLFVIVWLLRRPCRINMVVVNIWSIFLSILAIIIFLHVVLSVNKRSAHTRGQVSTTSPGDKTLRVNYPFLSANLVTGTKIAQFKAVNRIVTISKPKAITCNF